MFVKSSTSASILLAFASFASASPVFAKKDDVAAPAVPDKLLLTPTPPASGDGSNLNLTTQDNYLWGHEEQGIQANLTVQASSDFRLLSSPNFQDVVESINCTTDDITIKFGSASSLQAAQTAWAWVNQDDGNTLIYVADDETCAGAKGRQPFSVQSITYDTTANSALMAATKTSWADFAEDASIRISGVPVDGNAARSISKDVSIDIGHDFSGPIYNTSVDGVDIGLVCSQCSTQGSLNADITLSLFHGFGASLTTSNNLGATVVVSATASGNLTNPLTTSIPVATIPLAGFAIADVVDIGPQLNIAVDAGISGVNAAATASLGSTISIPDGSGFSLGQGADIQPNIQPAEVFLSGSVSMTATVSPVFTVELAATFLGKGLVGGVALKAPALSATFAAVAGTDGTQNCGAAEDGHAQVSVGVNIGIEMDAFGGFGGVSDEPNKITVFNKADNLFSSCLTF